VKFFYSPTSPFVRKVMACAISRGIDRQIEKLPTNPHNSPPSFWRPIRCRRCHAW
jgi:glutathione S-transferase